MDSKIASSSIRFWLRRYKVDYYGHCWHESKNIAIYSGKHLEKNEVRHWRLPIDAPKLIKNQYPNIKLIVEPPKSFDKESNKLLLKASNVALASHDNLKQMFPIFLSQFYSISKAIKLFSEESANQTYDWVVLTRYDVFVLFIRKFADLPNQKLVVDGSGHGFSDLLLIGSPNQIKSLDVFPILSNLVENQIDLCPEKLKQVAFLRDHTKEDVAVIRLFLNIVRSNSVFSQFIWSISVFRRYWRIWLRQILFGDST